MLHRVLEPEVMDSAREAAAYDSMNHDAVNRQFVDDLLEFAGASDPAGQILDVGTGTAQIPIELCGRHSSWSVVGIDQSTGMLELGGRNVERANLSPSIRLEQVDAKQLPYASGSFGAVISNSIVHHIAEPSSVLSESVRVTAPGGILFFRDLLRPPDDAAVKRLVHLYAGDQDAYQQQLFDDSLRAALSLQEVRELVAPLRFDPQTVRTTSDRHWTWAVRKEV